MDNLIPKSHGVITPGQQAFIRLFTELPDNGHFYLTGGTALAEFYLGHRLSYDLDFFTGSEGLVQPVSYEIEKLSEKYGFGIQVVRRFATYVEFQGTINDEQIKIDLALDSPFRFQPAILSHLGIHVNNFNDLCVDKLLAFYGRAEPRDALDLFFILQYSKPEELVELARQKDPGFDIYWFAVALDRCVDFPDESDDWPVKMLIDWQPDKIKSLFHSWSTRLMESLKA